MSYSSTVSESATFTVTHARHMAAKIATDLKRIQRLYGWPSDLNIERYEAEAVALMKAGYLDTVWYGFKRNSCWIEPTLKYKAQDLYSGSADDDPGKIRPGADISRAIFSSFLTYSTKWSNLTTAEREAFKKGLPYIRTVATEPKINGYLSNDKTYSSGGRSLERAAVRSY
ncbi:hypothetical protein N9850_03360 [Granulosicoccus sp.]|nr:hypothetical protein [Granulosicoccus sp.]MDB4222787.1 hypothetical protein [Granulosicoccus sp.]